MGEPKWILLAEDDDDIRHIIKQSLEFEGKELELLVIEARDGLEAISKASLREFHCVVTDLNMPRSSGLDLIRALQTTPLNANTPTIVITGNGEDDLAERYTHIHVLPKPFEPRDLVRKVVQELKLGRMDDRIAAHLMNPFLNACRDFLTNELSLSAQIDSPSFKRSSECLIGDVHCTLTMVTDVTRNKFTLSFDQSFLDHVRMHLVKTDRSAQGTLTSAKATANRVCQELFELATESLRNQMGSPPRLAGTALINYRNENEYADLTRRAGITVTIRTPQGRLILTALAQASQLTRRI